MQRYAKTGFDPNATIWIKVTDIPALAALLKSESAAQAPQAGRTRKATTQEAHSIGRALRAALGRCLGPTLGSARG